MSKHRAAGWQLDAEKIDRLDARFRAKAERTGSWHVPADLQERVRAWVAERDGGAR